MKQIFITGAGGFLGKAIARHLIMRGYKIKAFSRNFYPELEDLGISQCQGDLRELGEVLEASRGCDAIVHTAAKVGIWGRETDFYRTNVLGTENILRACRAHRIKKLVYTSSPSVVMGEAHIEGADETTPFPSSYLCPYPATKKDAEQRVLSANGQDGLITAAIRPHFIWGPGDSHLLPKLTDAQKRGRLARVGTGRNRVDVTYIDNAAAAHVDLLERLYPHGRSAGKAYFVGDHDPVNLWDFVDELLASQGVGPVTKRVPYALAYAAGVAFEKVYKGLGKWTKDPPMTRFAARSMANSSYFTHKSAKADFGYNPKISTREGLRILIARTKAEKRQGH